MKLSVLNTYEFTVYGRPQQRGSKNSLPVMRNGKAVLDDRGRPKTYVKDSNERSGPWMSQIRDIAGKRFSGPLISGAILLSVRFYFSRPKSHYGTGKNSLRVKDSATRLHIQSPDLAKLIRCLEDALSGVVWKDDKLVFYYGNCGRFWTTESERAEVKIKEVEAI